MQNGASLCGGAADAPLCAAEQLTPSAFLCACRGLHLSRVLRSLLSPAQTTALSTGASKRMDSRRHRAPPTRTSASWRESSLPPPSLACPFHIHRWPAPSSSLGLPLPHPPLHGVSPPFLLLWPAPSSSCLACPFILLPWPAPSSSTVGLPPPHPPFAFLILVLPWPSSSSVCRLDRYNTLAGGVLTGKYLDQPAAVDQRDSAAARKYLDQPRGRMDEKGWGYTLYRYRSGPAEEATRAYARLARENGLSLTELSLRWCRARSAVTTTLLGHTSMSQLEEDLRFFQKTEPLPADLMWQVSCLRMPSSSFGVPRSPSDSLGVLRISSESF